MRVYTKMLIEKLTLTIINKGAESQVDSLNEHGLLLQRAYHILEVLVFLLYYVFLCLLKTVFD